VQLKPIHEQVVVLFGASSGIGRETALRFARRGAKVVVSARDEEGLRSLVAQIEREGGTALAVPAEATRFEEVRAVAERAVEAYGRLDTWVHLAAVSMWASFLQTTPEEFKRIVDVNLMGQVHGAMAALPHLIRNGRGALIPVASVEARRALPLQTAYAASKHGVDGFIESLRLEIQHEGLPISVTEILPATINTPLFEKSRTKLGVKPKGMPPVYPPDIVADAILYAAEHPVRDIVVGGAGKMMLMTQRLSPRVMDAMLARTGYTAQRTQQPKDADAPDNLFAPLPGYDRVEGDLKAPAHRDRVFARTERRRTPEWLITGATLGMVALLAGQNSRSARQG